VLLLFIFLLGHHICISKTFNLKTNVMKKIILFSFLFILFTSALYSQINKGSILLGGNIGFNNNKVKDTDKKSNSVSVSPAIGIAVKQNIVVGINLVYSHLKSTYDNPYSETENNSYGGSVFVRRYITLGKGFFLFGEADIYYQASDNTYSYTGGKNEQKGWSTGIYIYPGLSYAVSKRFYLETGLPQLANLGFSKSKSISNGTTEESEGMSFNVSAGSLSTISLGFRIFFAK